MRDMPFEHHIMYDSLITSYNVMFGSGHRQDLQELYRAIQEREGIMTSLLQEVQAAARPIRALTDHLRQLFIARTILWLGQRSDQLACKCEIDEKIRCAI